MDKLESRRQILLDNDSKFVRNGKLSYGTAGFRCRATLLHNAMFRCGICAALNSSSNRNCAIGVMVTASHNLGHDNGVKLIDHEGNMFDKEWSKIATNIVNSDSLFDDLNTFCSKGCVSVNKGKVIIGIDSRESSPSLAAAVKLGVESLGCEAIILKPVTTPMLHHIVAVYNASEENLTKSLIDFDQDAAINQYFEYYGGNFKKFMNLIHGSSTSTSVRNSAVAAAESILQPPHIFIDAANGVGALMIPKLSSSSGITMTVRNENIFDFESLNNNCGAEYVQKERHIPAGFFEDLSSSVLAVDPACMSPARKKKNILNNNSSSETAHDFADEVCCSIDGDGDRLVYFTVDIDLLFQLFDGDRIASLYAGALSKLLYAVTEEINLKHTKQGYKLRVGVVQTAYANGASTDFLNSHVASHFERMNPKSCISFNVLCSKTGVASQHQVAESNFDLAIYFEANGHGTMSILNMGIKEWVESWGVKTCESVELLNCFISLFNPNVGDALADILAVEASRALLNHMSLVQWSSIYSETHIVQQKEYFPRAFLDTLKPHPEHEKWLIEPNEIQEKIDSIVSTVGEGARAFIRPSGTEDCLRYFIEASGESAASDCEIILSKIRDVIKVAAKNYEI